MRTPEVLVFVLSAAFAQDAVLQSLHLRESATSSGGQELVMSVSGADTPYVGGATVAIRGGERLELAPAQEYFEFTAGVPAEMQSPPDDASDYDTIPNILFTLEGASGPEPVTLGPFGLVVQGGNLQFTEAVDPVFELGTHTETVVDDDGNAHEIEVTAYADGTAGELFVVGRIQSPITGDVNRWSGGCRSCSVEVTSDTSWIQVSREPAAIDVEGFGLELTCPVEIAAPARRGGLILTASLLDTGGVAFSSVRMAAIVREERRTDGTASPPQLLPVNGRGITASRGDILIGGQPNEIE